MISKELDLVIERGYRSMLRHPDHSLFPLLRHEIYNVLNFSDATGEQRVFKWLGVITARYALPFWVSARPTDSLPERLINLAEGIMKNTTSIDSAQNEANNAWEYLERLGETKNNMTWGNAFYAGQAALEALQEVLGRDPFKEIIIDENTTDSDLDPWCSDTAHWAVIACSGFAIDRASDVDKGQAFWGWWLKEAIPAAIRFSNLTTA